MSETSNSRATLNAFLGDRGVALLRVRLSFSGEIFAMKNVDIKHLIVRIVHLFAAMFSLGSF